MNNSDSKPKVEAGPKVNADSKQIDAKTEEGMRKEDKFQESIWDGICPHCGIRSEGMKKGDGRTCYKCGRYYRMNREGEKFAFEEYWTYAEYRASSSVSSVPQKPVPKKDANQSGDYTRHRDGLYGSQGGYSSHGQHSDTYYVLGRCFLCGRDSVYERGGARLCLSMRCPSHVGFR
jgi:hypothetical protein